MKNCALCKEPVGKAEDGHVAIFDCAPPPVRFGLCSKHANEFQCANSIDREFILQRVRFNYMTDANVAVDIDTGAAADAELDDLIISAEADRS